MVQSRRWQDGAFVPGSNRLAEIDAVDRYDLSLAKLLQQEEGVQSDQSSDL
jgi:hypothetical protein